MAQHRPRFDLAFEHAEFAAQLCYRVNVERTYKQRIAHASEPMRIIAVAVQRDRRRVNENRLFFGAFYSVDESISSIFVALDGGARVLIGAGGDDRREMYHNVATVYEPIASALIEDSALYEFYLRVKRLVCFEKLARTLFVVAQYFYFIYAVCVAKRGYDRLTHVTGSSGYGYIHKIQSFVLG